MSPPLARAEPAIEAWNNRAFRNSRIQVRMRFELPSSPNGNQDGFALRTGENMQTSFIEQPQLGVTFVFP